MATVSVVFAKASDRGDHGSLPVIAAKPAQTPQALTTPATSSAAASDGLICRVVADGPVWCQIGPSASASAGNDWYIPAGAVLDFGRISVGDVVSVVDA